MTVLAIVSILLLLIAIRDRKELNAYYETIAFWRGEWQSVDPINRYYLKQEWRK